MRFFKESPRAPTGREGHTKLSNYRHHQTEARFQTVIPVPRPVTAVFDNPDGTEYRESVLLIGLDTSGEVHFLTADEDGIFCDPSDTAANFNRFEFL